MASELDSLFVEEISTPSTTESLVDSSKIRQVGQDGRWAPKTLVEGFNPVVNETKPTFDPKKSICTYSGEEAVVKYAELMKEKKIKSSVNIIPTTALPTPPAITSPAPPTPIDQVLEATAEQKKGLKSSRLIHDPEDSDMEVEIDEDVNEGEEFAASCEPILSSKALQSLKDREKNAVDPKIADLLFRLGHHQEVPMVTLMTGRDLKMLSLLTPLPRKDETWLGFAKATSDEHLNGLKLFASNVREEDQLVHALIEALERLRVTREWRWSTTLKRATSLQGALAILPLYFKGSVPIYLKKCPVWVKHLSHFSKRAKEEAPKQAKPTSAEQVQEAIGLFKKKNVAIAVALMLGWLTAARLGCILQLQKEDVRIDKNRFSVTFKRGKGVRLRGPYTVYSIPLPDQWMEIWREYIKTRNVKLFSESVTGCKLKEALREVDPELEQRSIRRGALQTMAEFGTEEDTLMLFSGHTQVSTLRRYLNWNQINRRTESLMGTTAEPLIPQQLRKEKKVKPPTTSTPTATKPSQAINQKVKSSPKGNGKATSQSSTVSKAKRKDTKRK